MASAAAMGNDIAMAEIDEQYKTWKILKTRLT
jgi:hypothetical protein